MSDSPNIDPAAVERLQRLGGSGFVCKMVDLFLNFTAAKIAEARLAQGRADWPGLAKATHPIKSSAGNVGAVRVQELARQLEQLGKEGGGDGLEDLVSELEREFAAVKPWLEQRISLLGGEAPQQNRANQEK